MHIHTYSVDLRLVTPSELLVIRPLPFGILAFQHFYTTEPWMLCCLLGYIISFLALFFFVVNIVYACVLQPVVCNRELCVFAFQTLGVMADAADEVATGAEVSAVTFCCWT